MILPSAIIDLVETADNDSVTLQFTKAPVPADQHVRSRMRSQGRGDTQPEVELRRELHRRGLRFRVQRRVEFDRRRTIDIAFPRQKVAVFVDGCFWHLCPVHAVMPVNNAAFWRTKLEANRDRDNDTSRRLEEGGWTVLRIWEHEDACRAADEVEAIVTRKKNEQMFPSD